MRGVQACTRAKAEVWHGIPSPMREWLGIFLLHRPYSLPDVAAMGLTAVVLSGVKLTVVGLLRAAGISVAIWCFATAFLEFIHAHHYRRKISGPYVATSLFAVGLSTGKDLRIAAASIAAVLFTYLYVLKNRSRVLAILSPISRGLVQVAIFLAAVPPGSSIFGKDFVLLKLSAFIFFYYVARNFIAEIRDVHWDGWNVSSWLEERGVNARLLGAFIFMLSASFGGHLMPEFRPLFLLPLGVALSVVTDRTAYRAHQFSIVASTMMFLAIALKEEPAKVGMPAGVLMALSIYFVGVWYDAVPRPANPKFPAEERGRMGR